MEDTVKHTVEVCLAWAEHHRVIVEAIGGGDLSRPAQVEAMVRGGPEVWEAPMRSSGASEGEAFVRAACCRPTPLPPLEGTSGPTDVACRSLATVGAGLRAASSE